MRLTGDITPRAACQPHPCGDDPGPCPSPSPSPTDSGGPGTGPAEAVVTDSTYTFDAHGAAIGRIDLVVNDGHTNAGALQECDPDGTVADVIGERPDPAPCEDGLLIVDTATGFALHARITALAYAGLSRHVRDARQLPHPFNTLDDSTLATVQLVNQDRPMRIGFRADGTDASATISNLPQQLTVQLKSHTKLGGGPTSTAAEYWANKVIQHIDVTAQLEALPNPLSLEITDLPRPSSSATPTSASARTRSWGNWTAASSTSTPRRR